MKKLIIVVATVGLLGIAGMQIASANSGYWQSGNYGYCGQGYGADQTKNNTIAETFNAETQDIRRGLTVKGSELRALLNNDNADAKRVAQLSGEIFDLEADLNKKAKDVGLTARSSYGLGPDMMRDNSYRNGGRNMMGW